MLEPERDPYELLLLIVIRTLPEIGTKTHKRGFINLISTLWERYLYKNKIIEKNLALSSVNKKENIRQILEALLEETDLIHKIQEGGRTYYVVDTQKSRFWKNCVLYFSRVEIERYLK